MHRQAGNGVARQCAQKVAVQQSAAQRGSVVEGALQRVQFYAKG